MIPPTMGPGDCCVHAENRFTIAISCSGFISEVHTARRSPSLLVFFFLFLLKARIHSFCFYHSFIRNAKRCVRVRWFTFMVNRWVGQCSAVNTNNPHGFIISSVRLGSWLIQCASESATTSIILCIFETDEKSHSERTDIDEEED